MSGIVAVRQAAKKSACCNCCGVFGRCALILLHIGDNWHGDLLLCAPCCRSAWHAARAK